MGSPGTPKPEGKTEGNSGVMSAAMTNGGAQLVRTIAKAGIDTIFALHGAHVDSIFQAAVDQNVALVDVRHEAAAGHAAEGYARTTRRPGIAVVTSGAGFTNIISSIANAYTDHTPVLYISGAPALGDAETNTLQAGIDHVAIAAPITKWSHQINRPQDIARLVAHALRVATTAPMGPVFLNIPMDVGMMPFPDPGEQDTGAPIIDSPGFPAPERIAAVSALLASAARPIVLAGAEAWFGDAGAALLRFVETSGIPVFSDFVAHGLIPADHPLYGGTGHKLAYLGDVRPDLVIALGTRFGLFTLGKAEMLFPADAKVVHMTEDATEIGKVRRVDIGIIASAAPVLDAMTEALPARRRDGIDTWAQMVRDARRTRLAELDAAAAGDHDPIHPWHAVRAIATAARDHILVADGAEAYHWLNDAVAQANPGSYLTHGHLGCMGIGLGLAIGAQAGQRDRRVVLMTGDGAVGFNIAEFGTMVRHDLPIVVIVMKNCSWGASQRFQEIVPFAEHIVGTTLADVDYAGVARGFGADGVTITALGDLAPAIDAAFSSGRPTCIDLRVDFNPVAPELGLMMSQTQS